MNKNQCPYEEKVLMQSDGTLSQELTEHVAQCATCSDLLLVGSFMKQLATPATGETCQPEPLLPSPEKIWHMALSDSPLREELARKALRPLIIPQIMAAVGVVIAILWLGMDHLSQIKAFFGNTVAGNSTVSAIARVGGGLLDTFVLSLPILGVVVFTFLVYVLSVAFKPHKISNGQSV